MQEYAKLQNVIKGYGKVAVAFSAGVDSTLLLRVAIDTLGAENVLALTASADFIAKDETRQAQQFCEKQSVQQLIVPIEEENIEHFCENPKNRCYYCKKQLFQCFIQTAKEHGFDTVVEGSNLDDLGDYRPGLRALAELGIQSPFRECEMTKKEIRTLSKKLGLATFDKPSFACLASRFAYGERITKERLFMVEQAESYLKQLGCKQYRVRIHGETHAIARIELPKQEMAQFLDGQDGELVQYFKTLGFSYVCLDLEGYRTGSMNKGVERSVDGIHRDDN